MTAIIQSSILPLFPILGLVPNLMLLIVMGWGFHRGPNQGMVWAVIGGLLVDLATGGSLGLSVLPFLAAVLIASVGFARVYRANLVLPAVITLAALLVYQTSYLVLAAIVGQTVLWEQVIRQVLLPWLILHLALMPLIYLAASWLAARLSSPDLRFGD